MPDPLRIEADYLVETAYAPEAALEAMAGEQSSGTFVPIPGETIELKARASARVERFSVLEDDVAAPALPGAKGTERRRLLAATLSWPLANVGPSLPNLLATVAGNLFELRQFSGLRLTDIRLPAAFAEKYGGPRFGIAGTRRLTGVEGRPLIGTIIKPSVGLGPAETAQVTQALCEGGIDFIKDDELQADGPHCPFEARAQAVLEVVRRHADKTGRKVMYALNITGDLDEMRRRHDLVQALGGSCVMASLNSVGVVGMIELARHSALPIHAHRNGWGYLSRAPRLGWSYVAWQKIWRLAGADHMHVNGLDSKFAEGDDSVIASARACLSPIFDDRPCLAMPVFSAGQTVRQAPGTYAGLGSADLIVTAGGGIMAHPDGIAAGVEALRAAWEATLAGIPLERHARSHRALARALEGRAA